jgi:hypothetical protein
LDTKLVEEGIISATGFAVFFLGLIAFRLHRLFQASELWFLFSLRDTLDDFGQAMVIRDRVFL